MDNLDKLQQTSKRSAIISAVGIFIFISSLLYSAYHLFKTSKTLDSTKVILSQTQGRLRHTRDSLTSIGMKVQELKKDEANINEYVINLLKSTQENYGGSSQDVTDSSWNNISTTFLALPSGRRKLAVTIALLTTWKQIPFELGKNNIKSSFDSPGYISYVLSQVNIKIKRQSGEPYSVTMMKKFRKVEDPLPGDLMFYKGQVGNFGLIYLSPGIGIGTLQAVSPLGIYETKYMNTEYFPFVGYFRVDY
jgi:cell wall-associated NlpC family hydrolase